LSANPDSSGRDRRPFFKCHTLQFWRWRPFLVWQNRILSRGRPFLDPSGAKHQLSSDEPWMALKFRPSCLPDTSLLALKDPSPSPPDEMMLTQETASLCSKEFECGTQETSSLSSRIFEGDTHETPYLVFWRSPFWH
jgi:hypothetical protein